MKYRSKVNFGQVYAGDKQGFNLGLDSSVFVRKETTPRVFAAPRIGTQGKSVSGTTPSEDISAGPGTSFKANVHGRGALDVTLVITGLTTGVLIAAALESAINAAMLAAGFDERVWAQFVGGKYEIYDQATGLLSSVAITDAVTNNVADELKLGTLNTGTETPGTDDQDFLLITTGGPKFEQPIETNAHRSGRFHSGIIKKKMMAEYDLETYVNMNGSAGASIDAAVRLLFESAFGTETASGVSIDYTQGLPSFYFSMARVSTIFGEYYTGCYEKELGLTFPGDGPATVKHTGKACKAAIAGLAKVIAPGATASATVPVTADEENRFSAGGRVMVVDTDGRTILAGADGSLEVVSTSDLANTVLLSAPVTVATGGFLTPWHPGAVQQTGRDNVFTDLVGSMKLRQGGASIDVTNISLTMANDPVDLDNIYGADANKGAVYGNRATMTLSVTFNLSNENFGEVVLARKFEGLAPEIILGDAAGRHLRIRAPKWMPAVPAIEVPENGTTPVTLEGILYESAPGQRDPIAVSFR